MGRRSACATNRVRPAPRLRAYAAAGIFLSQPVGLRGALNKRSALGDLIGAKACESDDERKAPAVSQSVVKGSDGTRP